MSGSQSRSQSDSRRCPICAKPAAVKYRPFCSQHCANADLGRWLSERYVIETNEPADGEAGSPEDGGND